MSPHARASRDRTPLGEEGLAARLSDAPRLVTARWVVDGEGRDPAVQELGQQCPVVAALSVWRPPRHKPPPRGSRWRGPRIWVAKDVCPGVADPKSIRRSPLLARDRLAMPRPTSCSTSTRTCSTGRSTLSERAPFWRPPFEQSWKPRAASSGDQQRPPTGVNRQVSSDLATRGNYRRTSAAILQAGGHRFDPGNAP